LDLRTITSQLLICPLQGPLSTDINHTRVAFERLSEDPQELKSIVFNTSNHDLLSLLGNSSIKDSYKRMEIDKLVDRLGIDLER
jgi:hypothetical protein